MTERSPSVRSTSPRASCSPRSTARRSRADGFRVDRAFNLGPREFVAPALAAGLIEFLPEYAGTALQFVSLDADSAAFDVTDDARCARARTDGSASVTALAAAPAQDANAFVVRRETAERYGLQRLSDVARVASQLTFGGPPECPSRPAVPGRIGGGLRFEVRGVRCARRRRSARRAMRSVTASSTSRCCSRRTPRSRAPISSNWKMIAACSRQRTSRRSSALPC